MVAILGLAPLVASTYLQSMGVYRIELVVRDTNGQPVKDAEVSTSVGSQIQKGSGYWEIDISPQTRPPDSRVQVFASLGAKSGVSTVSLGHSFYIPVTIDLAAPQSALIRGIVKDSHGKGVQSAHVSVAGYKDGTNTDEWGNFELPAHAAEGQMVTLRATKSVWTAEATVPVGATAELTLGKSQ
jgi:hypothetical protein